MTDWPTQANVEAFFGPPAQNQVMFATPYPMRLAWDTGTIVNRFQCHAKVVDAFSRIFTQTLMHYGIDQIRELRLDLFGGCFNHRPMRGGTQLSMHSWGIAIDLDPERNQLNWNRSRAAFARPEYEPFWGFVEKQGLVSLGRERDFDWMHFQAARLTAGASTSGGNVTAPPSTTEPPAPDGFLRVGSRGEAVADVQRRLGLKADGIFGPATQRAVMEFQRGMGLTADGVVGPITSAALYQTGE